MRRASAGLAPPVETAIARSPWRTIEGRMKLHRWVTSTTLQSIWRCLGVLEDPHVGVVVLGRGDHQEAAVEVARSRRRAARARSCPPRPSARTCSRGGQRHDLARRAPAVSRPAILPSPTLAGADHERVRAPRCRGSPGSRGAICQRRPALAPAREHRREAARAAASPLPRRRERCTALSGRRFATVTASAPAALGELVSELEARARSAGACAAMIAT